MGEIEFREYRPGDEAGILATFNTTFSESWTEGYVDRGLAHWRWLYELNPAGRRIVIGVDDDGTVACQYAGIPMRVLGPEGRELSFFHAVDSMVHPAYRKGLRKRGLFLEVAERYFERFGGHDDHLGFGYPVRAAWRIGERYLGYGLVRTVDFLVREIEPSRVVGSASETPADIEVRPVDWVRDGTALDALFARVGASYACVTIKDARYLSWRYGPDAPIRYEVLIAHSGATPAGLAVVRTSGSLVPDSATIGDLLVAPGDEPTLNALVASAQDLAIRDACRSLIAVENPCLFAATHLRTLGFESHPSSNWFERKLGSRDWTSGLSQEWLASNWSYCLGDSDLF
ncbi:MAG: GNAT family N-acetyltransferase [Planctomycetes bacterium]|nr:GNAT family N-acetyltransferase [Planctomycetota bacterium]MCB9919045.1 GNAT family N-acetyltransferase [Planctomycetota bacterium]